MPIGKGSSSTPGAAGARAVYMELRLRSAAAAASWLAQCRRAAVETAPPAGQAGSSGSSGFKPRMAADDRADRCPVRTGTGADSRGALASRSKLYSAGGLPLWAAAVALDGRVRDASLP